MSPYRKRATWLILVATWFAGTLVPSTVARAATAQQDPPVPPRLTLDLAIEILLDRNPTILAERQNVAVARAGVVSARQLPNPVLAYEAESAGASALPDTSFWDDQDLNLTIEQRIRIGGSRSRLGRVADEAVLGAQATLQDTIRRLTLELKGRYWGVVLAAQQVELATEVLGQFDQVVRLTEQRYEQGEASGLEVSRLRTERLRFFNDQVIAELGLANAKVALLELLGARALSADFEIEEELAFDRVTVELQDLQEEALRRRPDLAAQGARVEQARRGQDYERSLRVPDLVPYFGYNRDFGQDNLTFGVSVAVPIFDRNQGGIARAVAETDREQQALRAGELVVRREVHQAVNSVAAHARLVEAMQTDYVPNADRARDIAQASFALGALDLIAFLDAERAYRETLRGYYQALHDHQVSRFVLEAAVGRERAR